MAGTPERNVTTREEANIVRLYVVEGKSLREVMLATGRPYGTVYNVLRRNKVKMRLAGRASDAFYRQVRGE